MKAWRKTNWAHLSLEWCSWDVSQLWMVTSDIADSAWKNRGKITVVGSWHCCYLRILHKSYEFWPDSMCFVFNFDNIVSFFSFSFCSPSVFLPSATVLSVKQTPMYEMLCSGLFRGWWFFLILKGREILDPFIPSLQGPGHKACGTAWHWGTGTRCA